MRARLRRRHHRRGSAERCLGLGGAAPYPSLYCSHPPLLLPSLDEGPPRSRARCFTNLEPGTFIGPVEQFVYTDRFATVLVRGFWINVWTSVRGGVHYARRVPDREVARWRRNGWFDAVDAAPAG